MFFILSRKLGEVLQKKAGAVAKKVILGYDKKVKMILKTEGVSYVP